MNYSQIIEWLLDGDPSIQFQVYRDLLSEQRPNIRDSIEFEGWGAELLRRQNPDGHWGVKFYQPKWTSSHYTLLDLRNLCISSSCKRIKRTVDMIAAEEKGPDGGINPAGSIMQSDVCINGMFLNYACWFTIREDLLVSVVDFILSQVMPDGGFNCRFNRSGADHSSLHSTISVCEGIAEYRLHGYTYRLDELKAVESSSQEFMLKHQLFRSDRSGEIIHKDFLRLPYPGRWKYDILRALDYFQYAAAAPDERMEPALDVLMKKRREDGRWNVQAKHPGEVHFEYEKPGQPSRWNTLRALRVLQTFRAV